MCSIHLQSFLLYVYIHFDCYYQFIFKNNMTDHIMSHLFTISGKLRHKLFIDFQTDISCVDIAAFIHYCYQFGNIVAFNICTSRYSRRRRYQSLQCFVEYENAKDAQYVYFELQAIGFQHHSVFVDYARPHPDKLSYAQLKCLTPFTETEQTEKTEQTKQQKNEKIIQLLRREKKMTSDTITTNKKIENNNHLYVMIHPEEGNMYTRVVHNSPNDYLYSRSKSISRSRSRSRPSSSPHQNKQYCLSRSISPLKL